MNFKKSEKSRFTQVKLRKSTIKMNKKNDDALQILLYGYRLPMEEVNRNFDYYLSSGTLIVAVHTTVVGLIFLQSVAFTVVDEVLPPTVLLL